MPIVSIIIPVFNSEVYLQRCIDSVLLQKCCDIEVILVDDGSTDNSPKICDDYSRIDSRVVTIHKQNGGVSSARNMGIKRASGKWIGFVDSDDWVEPSYIENLLPELDEELCVNSFILEGGTANWHTIDTRQTIVLTDSSEFDANRVLSLIELQAVACKLFIRDIVIKNNILFDELIQSKEDSLFVAEYLSKISKIRLCPDKLYHYFRGADSSLSKVDRDVRNGVWAYKNERLFNAYLAIEDKFDVCCSRLKIYCSSSLINDCLMAMSNAGFAQKYKDVSEMINSRPVRWLTSRQNSKLQRKRGRILGFLIRNKLALLVILYNRLFPEKSY